MPKRSNDFQRLVRVIHEAFASNDQTRVTESAMLQEPDGTQREVDILLERTVNDVLIRIAVECRDRSRKSDVEWIDGLVGKFANLNVDKVIAVCRRGFSGAASAKANANKIDLRVLAECLGHEWESEFIRVGFASFEFTPTLGSVEVTLDPAPQEDVSSHSVVHTTAMGSTATTLGAVILACYQENVAPRVKKYVEDNFLSANPPLADLTRSWELTVPVEINETWVVSSSGSRHRLVNMIYDVRAESRAEVSLVRHFAYGATALASEGDIKFGEDTRRMRVVQVAGRKTLTVNVAKPHTK